MRAASSVVMPIALAKLPTIVPACIPGVLYTTTFLNRVANAELAKLWNGRNCAAGGRALAHSITFRHRDIPDKFPQTLTNGLHFLQNRESPS
jgi:hypothetical protein